jgi:hypothetical protein
MIDCRMQIEILAYYGAQEIAARIRRRAKEAEPLIPFRAARFHRVPAVRIPFAPPASRSLANGRADPMHPDRHRLRCRPAARRRVG